MKKITIITFGKIKSAPINDLITYYSKLISRYYKLELKQLKDVGERKIESDDINVDESLIILTEKGKTYTSLGFKDLLISEIENNQQLTFLIGNAHGISNELISKNKTLALSSLTFPHELSEVILLEQLYRSFDISRGGKYHK